MGRNPFSRLTLSVRKSLRDTNTSLFHICSCFYVVREMFDCLVVSNKREGDACACDNKDRSNIHLYSISYVSECGMVAFFLRLAHSSFWFRNPMIHDRPCRSFCHFLAILSIIYSFLHSNFDFSRNGGRRISTWPVKCYRLLAKRGMVYTRIELHLVFLRVACDIPQKANFFLILYESFADA